MTINFYEGKINKYLSIFIKNKEDMKDVRQNVYISLLNYKEISNALIYKTVKCKSLDFLLKKNRYNLQELEDSIEQKTFYDEKIDPPLLERIDYNLSEPIRLYVYGLKYREIAEELNISLDDVKQRIWKGRQELKKYRF